ncbi:XTP/dITP diphosphatase [Radiobacillus sp. PE A8.2]|uniref:XTP/dITP diphosphatase n=1 Tax=Radiobacillus sp. PE A8.2 TaxID=3380349 RepID=UPI00389020BC
MNKLIIATKNKGKMKDFEVLFSKYGIEVSSLLDLDESIPDIEETGDTFEENAAIKAEAIAASFGIPVLADDSGLMVDALEGRPGVYSARYAGIEKDDVANYEKLLSELTDVPDSERTARFVCVLALAQPNHATLLKRGTCEGRIGLNSEGTNGFGYDPIFIPNGYDQTMAQLTAEEKNQISHRKNAIVQLEDWLKQQI